MDRITSRLVVALLLSIPVAQLHAQQATTTGTLLIQRVQQKPAHLPTRGMTTQHVEQRYGAPKQRLSPVGGQKRVWPAIERWVYPDFTVYFEHGRVIDAVVNQASPDEIGPKPAKR